MSKANTSLRWGAGCAIVAGLTFLVPMVFYFYFLPAAGSSATHAQDPASFLPWMAEHGSLRTALWWATGLPFLVALLGVPAALKERLNQASPTAARTAELAGLLGFSALLLACLMLAAGELPLAQAYVTADASARSAIVAIYEWQRLVTALLFDALGLFLLGVWILVSSAVGLRAGRLPKWLSWFGVVAALTVFSFVTGYVTDIRWLGETGIGMLAFLTVPVWLIGLGIALWRTN